MVNFREPFFADVLEGGGGSDGEADEKDIGLGVGKRTETIIILLAGGIKETQGVWLIANPF